MKKRDEKKINKVLRRIAEAYASHRTHTLRHCELINQLQERIVKLEQLVSIDRKKDLN